jgi:hypothetical protein
MRVAVTGLPCRSEVRRSGLRSQILDVAPVDVEEGLCRSIARSVSR